MTTPTYRLLGGPGSPYSLKLRAALRYRRLPHVWIVPTGYINQGGELEKTGKKTIPVLQLPEDGSYWADSTPIIYALEQRHPDQRSLLPDDPANAFLSHLIDDFADEFLVGILFSYRWGNALDIEFSPRRQLSGWLGTMPTENFEKLVSIFRERQVQKLESGDYGSPSVTTPLFAHVYLDLLASIESLVTESRFLFGSRPSLADIGLFGQLSQMAIDPTPSALMKQHAPRTFQWVQDLDDASGIEGVWRTPNESPPAALGRLLQLVVAVYLPVAKAHLQAVLQGQARVNASCIGMPYEGVTNPYTANCLLWIKDEYTRLKPNEQVRVANMLGDGVVAEYLHFLPGEAAHLAPHIPV